MPGYIYTGTAQLRHQPAQHHGLPSGYTASHNHSSDRSQSTVPKQSPSYTPASRYAAYTPANASAAGVEAAGDRHGDRRAADTPTAAGDRLQAPAARDTSGHAVGPQGGYSRMAHEPAREPRSSTPVSVQQIYSTPGGSQHSHMDSMFSSQQRAPSPAQAPVQVQRKAGAETGIREPFDERGMAVPTTGGSLVQPQPSPDKHAGEKHAGHGSVGRLDGPGGGPAPLPPKFKSGGMAAPGDAELARVRAKQADLQAIADRQAADLRRRNDELVPLVCLHTKPLTSSNPK